MSTATKVVKSIYSKLVKEQQTQSDERTADWRRLVIETVDTGTVPTDDVILFLASELGMEKENSIELFLHDVETVKKYNSKMFFLRKYETEYKAWHKDISVEEAKLQIEALSKELVLLRKKLQREQQLQHSLGTSRTSITQIIRDNRRLFERPDKSQGWLDLMKFPTKYKA
jgi:hypothetical protein